MDLGLSFDRAESFRIFQGMIMEQYDRMIETDNFVVMDGTLKVDRLQRKMREIAAERVDLSRYLPRKKT